MSPASLPENGRPAQKSQSEQSHEQSHAVAVAAALSRAQRACDSCWLIDGSRTAEVERAAVSQLTSSLFARLVGLSQSLGHRLLARMSRSESSSTVAREPNNHHAHTARRRTNAAAHLASSTVGVGRSLAHHRTTCAQKARNHMRNGTRYEKNDECGARPAACRTTTARAPRSSSYTRSAYRGHSERAWRQPCRCGSGAS
jgi:hypothetical protein